VGGFFVLVDYKIHRGGKKVNGDKLLLRGAIVPRKKFLEEQGARKVRLG
jgi:hypothetical protein